MPLTDRQSVHHETVDGLELTDRSLRHAEFEEVVFQNCRFVNVSWVACQFSSCRFVDCELTGASVPGSTFNSVHFERTRMMGLNFTELHQVMLTMGFAGCVLDYSVFAGMKLARTRFVDCRMREVDFSSTQLEQAVFAGSDLRAASFNHANLVRTDFRTAIDLCFDPKLVTLSRTRIELDALVAIGAQLGLDVGF